MSTTEEDDYGDDLVYDSELDEKLRAAESVVPDIEDSVGPPPQALSPFDEFRRRGFLSVSDLVGTVWCEVQFDYRLRTLPYLPVSKRPTTIKSTKGTSIAVDQVKVEGKERILKRGDTIHKRLEREIHPEQVNVRTESREDVWGLRMLNMFSAIQALLSLGKCRELPVAGFVDDMLVFGIIDEITREPIAETPTKGRQTRSKRAESGRQASLNDFFGGKPLPKARTHRLLVSDSKTRASGAMPREEDTLAGRLQVMLYKELVDALLIPQEPRVAPVEEAIMEPIVGVEAGSSEPRVVASPPPPDAVVPEAYLPTTNQFGSGLWRIWERLELDPFAQFTDTFIAQSRIVITSNLLRHGVEEGRTLADYATSWMLYVASLGLGAGPDEGRTDAALELVYRRAAPKRGKEAARKRRKGEGKVKSKGKNSRRSRRIKPESEVSAEIPASGLAMPALALKNMDVGALDEETQLELALQLNLQQSQSHTQPATTVEDDEAPIVVDSTEIACVGIIDTYRDEPVTGAELLSDSPATAAPAIGSAEEPCETPDVEMSAETVAPSQACAVRGNDKVVPESGVPSPSLSPPRSITPSPAPVGEAQQPTLSYVDSLLGSAPIAPAQQATSSLVDSLLGPAPSATPSGYRPTPRSVSSRTKYFTSDSEQEREDSELAWAVEMSLNTGTQDEALPSVGVGVMASPPPMPARRSRSRTPSPGRSAGGTASGSIIGRHRFTHDPSALAAHLASVLEYWRGIREPHGVTPANVRRCQWCEFEDGCEWLQVKAQEALDRYRSLRM